MAVDIVELMLAMFLRASTVTAAEKTVQFCHPRTTMKPVPGTMTSQPNSAMTATRVVRVLLVGKVMPVLTSGMQQQW